jgi:hypothetical protein
MYCRFSLTKDRFIIPCIYPLNYYCWMEKSGGLRNGKFQLICVLKGGEPGRWIVMDVRNEMGEGREEDEKLENSEIQNLEIPYPSQFHQFFFSRLPVPHFDIPNITPGSLQYHHP